jgi:hypothetical protein
MRIGMLSLALIAICASSLRAQEHLIPDTDVFTDPDEYKLKMRHIFAQAFDPGVKLRVLVTPSFSKEYVAGLVEKDRTVEVFVLEPSSTIWDTELIRMYESGELKPVTKAGKTIKALSLEENVAYQKLKKSTPADYRAIKAKRQARPVPPDVAGVLKEIWKEMLLNVRHPAEPEDGLDGTTYDFSAWISGRGDLSGHIWSPEPESKTGRLTKLADTLADYARGKADLDKLKERLREATKP